MYDYVLLFWRGVNVPLHQGVATVSKLPFLVYGWASLFDDFLYSLQREVAG
jgi:hypothetical protein